MQHDREKVRPGHLVAGGLVAVVVIGGGGVAWAANGRPVLIGKANSGTAKTSLTNSRGPALGLTSRAGSAPLTVSSRVKVTNLNADRLDGLDSASFARVSGATGFVSLDSEWFDADGDGIDDTLGTGVECPVGSVLTGGGVDNFTGFPTYINSPLGESTRAWAGASAGEPGVDAPADVVVYAICYNPRGGVAGATPTWAAPKRMGLPRELTQRLARVARR